MGLFENFKKGRDAAYVERGRATRLEARAVLRGEISSSRTAAPADDETRQLLAEVTTLGEELQKRNGELETDLQQLQTRTGELESELQQRVVERDEAQALLTELTATVEQLQARDSERALFSEVLQLPGTRTALAKLFGVDCHSDAGDDERRVLTEWSQKVNAAYELIKRDNKTADPGV